MRNNNPLTDTLGQISHQTVHTTQGQVIDLDEIESDVIDSNGLAVVSDDEIQLKEYIKNAISIDSLVETFNDNAHATLIKLLALQDNKHPLKKGGVGIAYRTDALIMHCKMEFSNDENIVFDSILGMISSYPENKTYRIEPNSFLSHSRYRNPKQLYAVFKKGAEKLQTRHLIFEDLGQNGEDSIVVPWFNILRYHNGRGNKGEASAYIEFAPSDFFKDLALCSQLVHGAYGALEVTTQLQGKYSIAIYWFLENKKNYKEFPNATQGIFRISIEELKHQFSIPESYTPTDIKRRVLDPAKRNINSVEECDFTFEYELQKVDGKYAGYMFTIKSKNYIEADKQNAIEDKSLDPFYNEIKTLLGVFRIELDEEQIKSIYSLTKELQKDSMFLTPIFMEFRKILDDKNRIIDNKGAYLYRMIENAAKFKPDKPTKSFERMDSYADIEEELIAN